ncbi:MAG: glutathione S-transferase C-terminal domain-containing protein, partial [Alphaproteobacteria bacterium]|nr:glutathione S-transferase C-terminal domain-containing protein [Alphaproteobacteria bacterium]
GEAGLGASIQVVVVSGFVAPEAERDNWGARWALNQFQNRRKLLTRQLAKAPYVAGDRFTAADISVTYTLNLAGRRGGIKLDDAEKAYMARTTGRDGYKRTLDACPATKGFYASVPML